MRQVCTVTRGPKPARALRELGVLPTLPSEDPTTEGVVEALQTREWRGARVGVQLCGDVPNDRIVNFLTAAGAVPVKVAPYAYVAAADDEKIVLVTRERLELSVPQLSWRDILRGAASRQIVLREIVALDRAPGLSGSLSESSHS